MGAELIVVSPMRAGELARLPASVGWALRCSATRRPLCALVRRALRDEREPRRPLRAASASIWTGLNAGAGWALPIPASYVVDQGGVIRFAFGDADWARRAEPADIVDAVRRIAQAADTAA